MAKLRKPTKADISALLSDDVALRKYRNQTILSKITVPRKSKSAIKKKCNNLFAEASAWATAIIRKPDMKKLYSKGINSKLSNAHTVALTDYMTAPKIHYISLKQYNGMIGDNIRIKATDSFQVTAVNVTITDKTGKVLETGPATRYKRKPVMWVYTLTVANPDLAGTVIEVTAMDRPGNKTEQKMIIEGNAKPGLS